MRVLFSLEIWTSILWNLPGQSLINILPQLKKAASVFRCGCRSVIITMSFTHTPHTRLESPSPSPPHLRIPVNILTQHQDPEVSKDPGPQSPAVAVSSPAGGGLLQVQGTPPPSPTSLRRLSTSVYPPSSPRSGSPASTSPSPPPLPHQNRGEMHENKINAESITQKIFSSSAQHAVSPAAALHGPPAEHLGPRPVRGAEPGEGGHLHTQHPLPPRHQHQADVRFL